MHRSTYWLAAGLLSCSFSLTGMARADALADVQKAGVLRVGVPQDYAPYGSVGADLQLQGLDIDVAKLLAQKLGVKIQLVPVASADRITWLQAHRSALLVSTLGRNAEREKAVDFSQAYAPFNNSVFGVANIKVANAADLAGKTIGVARGTLQDLQLTESAPKSATIKRYTDNNSLIQGYVTGHVQLVGSGDFVAYSLAEQAPDNKPVLKYVIHESACLVGVNKGEPALLAKVNDALTQAKKSGELNAIVRKWLNVPLPQKIAATYQ
ncbi:MAG: L-cystine-binding protein FliY [Herbaspirillum frisingense]|uniref:L-cystine-binding protein FliY n=1 Tax=Herbaspirillum frisingense TaxID=92645 RepID=A0A7V8JSI0_9BURK|nr:MAG: L-cystine-binding protein FliY [Herbaspirillum frisingense]